MTSLPLKVVQSPLAPKPPALLTMTDFYGTLAAARCLGRAGVPITTAESQLLAPARWSRYVRRRVSCPCLTDWNGFMSWLMDFGAREPGAVLYPTSDDLAWLYSLHSAELSRHFRLYQPSFQTITTVLNKKSLQRVAQTVGLDVPKTWFPEEGGLAKVPGEAKFPVLIKPRAQVFSQTHTKGRRVDSASELESSLRDFTAKNGYAHQLEEQAPDCLVPMIQEYHVEAARGIYNLSGFIDQTGELFSLRASVKVLQRPKQLGIGLCFEEADVQPELAQKVANLCKHVGYYGVFEIEFIQTSGRYLLIDFNPRFYNQMAFDIARGLPLPLLAYEAARGNTQGLAEEVKKANIPEGTERKIFCHHRRLMILMGAQALSGRMSREEREWWQSWYAAHQDRVVDAVADPEDPWPGLVDMASVLFGYARHPRRFMSSVMLDRG